MSMQNSLCILFSFGGLGYPRGNPLLRKNQLSPSDSPFPKIFAFIFLFYPLIQVYTDNKVIDKDKYPYKKPYSKNAKRKSGYTKILL